MRKSVAWIALAFVAAGCGGAQKASRSEVTARQIYERFGPAIVRVEGHGAAGTGFIVGADGRVATNLHVIAGSPRLFVVLSSGRRLPVDRVVAVDENHDLAIIGVRTEERLPTVTVGDSDQVATGDPVVAIGNPLFLDLTITSGLISARRQFSEKEVLQISAPISVGSSGGPLFNRYGEVIGVATFIAREGQNLNFGMPSNYLRPLLERQGSVSVEEFHDKYGRLAEQFRSLNHPLERELREFLAPPLPGGSHPQVTRDIPSHELAVLDGCSDELVFAIYQAIAHAIDMGAPVYNRGEYEACYVIYRNTAERMRDAPGTCRGVKQALTFGLERAASLDEPAAKAWAMRDAFDGLVDVARRRIEDQSGDKP